MSNKIQRGSEITATAHELDFRGQGVVKYNDLVIFVKGLLKDEEARILITNVKKRFAHGNIIEIIKPSKFRKSETSNLGSVDLAHLTEEAQVKWQSDVTENTFKKIIDKKIDTDKTIKTEEYINYRNKTVFHTLSTKPLTLGLYDTNHKLVKVDNFILADDITNNALKFINDLNINLANNNLKHIVFRTNSYKELMIILVSKAKDRTLDKLIEHLLTIENLKTIYINISPNSRHILGDRSQLIYGDKLLVESYNGTKVYFNDRSFLQTNYNVTNKLYQVIKDNINSGDIVVDAYSGAGSIGFTLLDKASKVMILESNTESVKMIRLAIKDFNYQNTRVYIGDVVDTIDKVNGDVLIIDPPRNGMTPEFIEKIKTKDFKKIIYLSCNISTQARDVGLLLDQYTITDINPVKMFYQTTAIENLIILERK